MDTAHRESSETRLLHQLKEHVVQLESLVTFLVIVNVVLYLLPEFRLQLPVWLIPCLLLILLRPIMRVMNPSDDTRNRLVWAGVGAGIGGTIGGAIDVATFGLTLGQGTLLGMTLGGALGGALGKTIERNPEKLLERGEAFDYLYKFRRRNPKLANPHLIDKALDNSIQYFDKNKDGREWYAIEDLDQYIRDRNN